MKVLQTILFQDGSLDSLVISPLDDSVLAGILTNPSVLSMTIHYEDGHKTTYEPLEKVTLEYVDAADPERGIIAFLKSQEPDDG